MAGYIGSKANVSQIDGYVKSEVDTLLGQELNLSGGSMTGHLNFGDNIKSQYGAGTDLQIYHDASHSYIKDAGTGNLRLSATTIELMKVDTSELMASFAQDGAVTLYYDNAAKLATATGGVDVTGNIVVSGTVDGIDIATRDAVLTSTTTTAGAALPKAGGTMTGNLSIEGADSLLVKDQGSILLYNTNDDNYARIRNTTASGNELQFSTNAVAMTIDINGKVGIGTASPDAKLEVSNITANDLPFIISGGTSSLGSLPETTGMLFGYGSAATYKKGAIIWEFTETNARGKLHFCNDSSSDSGSAQLSDSKMTIDKSGNVGIGIASPGELLHVEGSSPSIKIKANNEGGSAELKLQSDQGDDDQDLWSIKADPSHSLDFINYVSNSWNTRMRIDSSGTLLVGKASDTFATVGTSIFDHGEVHVTRAGSVPMYLRRNTNDGTILEFRKDGTAVGSIGSSNSGERLYVVNDSTGLSFLGDFSRILPCDSAGAARDAAIDLGQGSGGRFKDLYLSGGAYLGGTAAANKLEDYEEGTWTPAFLSVNSTTPTGSFSHAGTYTKIGQLVTLIGYMQINTSGTLNVGGGTLAITGQPFTAIVGDGKQSVGAITAHQWNPERNDRMGVTTYDGTRLGFLTANDNSGWVWEQTGSLKSGTVMRFSISYHTTS